MTTPAAAADRAIVVGAGLAGLTAAAHLARAGHDVTVVEAAGVTGGRARTTEHAGFRFNLGAHALYAGGAAAAILRDLGIDLPGRGPQPQHYRLLAGGRVRNATTWGARRGGAVRALSALSAGRRADDDRTLADWLDERELDPRDRAVVELYVRTATYAHDPARLSAGAAAAQLRVAVRGVRYLDGGWQALVDAVEQAALDAGARVVRGRPATAVLHDDRVRGVRLGDDAELPADRVVIAVGSARDAARLLATGPAHAVVDGWAGRAVPVRAACLDVALAHLPRPRTVTLFDLAGPRYLSVHSRWGRLAPGGGALVHLLRYLGPDEPDPARDRAALEELLDVAQPGWRDAVVHARFLPQMTVATALPTAADGGLGGRPGPGVPGVAGLAVAGDWVGPTGMLADAALASARAAAMLPADRVDGIRLAAGAGSDAP
jgi:phytoene dehydrogenase-like protein